MPEGAGDASNVRTVPLRPLASASKDAQSSRERAAAITGTKQAEQPSSHDRRCVP